AEVAAHNVIVQDGFDFPSLLLGHLGEVLTAVQTLLFSRHRQKNDCRWELKFAGSLAQHTGAFQAYGGAAAIVIRSRRRVGAVESVAIPGIVMAGDEHDAIRLLRVGPAPPT